MHDARPAPVRRLAPLALLLALILAACAPIIRNHGYVPDEAALSGVVIGQTTRDELPMLIGRPSAEGVLTGSAWFYVKSRFSQFGPNPSREVKREVVAISFTDSGTVSNVERFGLERGRIVVLSQRVTDQGVSAVGALRQILGNFGRFRATDILNK